MKYLNLKLIAIVLIFTLTNSLIAQDTNKKILFVGNSLTKYKKNKMTEILQEFIEEANTKYKIEVEAKNGFRLNFHTSSIQLTKNKGISYGGDTIAATTMQTIINGNYDFVVLQDPDWLIKIKREKNFYPSVKFIDHHTDAKILFYQTVPVFKEPVTFCYGCSAKYTKHAPDSIKIKKEELIYKNIEHQLDTIRAVGDELCSEIAPGSIIIPTGEIVYELHNKLPHVSMTIGGGHPSKIVQYALAVTFYTYLTNKDPRELSYSFSLADGDAKLVRAMVYNYWSSNKLEK